MERGCADEPTLARHLHAIRGRSGVPGAEPLYARRSVALPGLARSDRVSHGLRRELHSFAAPRLEHPHVPACIASLILLRRLAALSGRGVAHLSRSWLDDKIPSADC